MAFDCEFSAYLKKGMNGISHAANGVKSFFNYFITVDKHTCSAIQCIHTLLVKSAADRYFELVIGEAKTTCKRFVFILFFRGVGKCRLAAFPQ